MRFHVSPKMTLHATTALRTSCRKGQGRAWGRAKERKGGPSQPAFELSPLPMRITFSPHTALHVIIGVGSPHFMEEDTEAQRIKERAKGHIASK